MVLQIESYAFNDGAFIPSEYTCEGQDRSPELHWRGVPDGTKSFALICDDPDAPAGTWVHWVIYNIPETAKTLQEGISSQDTLSSGAKQGVNDFRRIGYGGPCPPRGTAHRYYFKLYALDAMLELDPKATKRDLERAMEGHILAKTQLMGRYAKSEE